jgi:hypothetical protein
VKVSINTLVWSLIATSGLTIFLCALVDDVWLTPAKEPQLYTVHFDGIDYQDLSRHWFNRGGSSYRTKSGKRIEFRGNFYEVEQ